MYMDDSVGDSERPFINSLIFMLIESEIKAWISVLNHKQKNLMMRSRI